jgi:hypothetical protein
VTHKYDAGEPRSDVMRRLAQLERLIQEMAAGRRLEAATIGAGGVTVRGTGGITLRDGGGVTVRDGGDVSILDGGDLIIDDGGNLQVRGGGQVEIFDGGAFIARYSDGRTAAMFGPLHWMVDFSPMGHGLLIQRSNAAQHDVLRAMQMVGGATVVWTGETGIPIDECNYYAEETVVESTVEPLLLIGNGSFELAMSYQGTALAANAYLDTDGFIHRSSSSRRGKTDIADLDVDPATVLRARPRVFRDAPGTRGGGPTNPHRAQRRFGGGRTRTGLHLPAGVTVDEPPPPPPAPTPPAADRPPGPLVPGFIAEELADDGLGQFVTYDKAGQPEGVAYDRMCAALLIVCRDQQQRIDDLTARVAALERR